MPPTSPRTGHAGKIPIGPKKKIAFVCSGGATKAGAFHLGVALALKEQGFRFFGGLAPSSGPARTPGPMEISTYVGSSAGSMITSFLAAGYSLENIFNSFLGRAPTQPEDATPRILERLTYSKMFKIRPELAREQLGEILQVRKILKGIMAGDVNALFQLRWLKATGLFSTAGLEQYMREEVLPSNRFQDYLADLFIVATQLNHSRKVVFGKYSYEPPPHDLTCQYSNDVPISQACAASTALPFIFAPFPIKRSDGKQIWYIDGELRDTLSSHVAIDAGADLVIASHTHQPYHFSREIGSLTEHGLPAILIQSIYLIIEQKINHHIHNKQIQRNAIQAVNRFCKSESLPDSQRKRILEILENELHHRMDVDTIYIHPSPSDAKTFFAEHFSLSSQRLTDIVRSGFKAAIDTLRKYDFADRSAPSQTIVETKDATGT
jgi:predicted acylesterase/phospholipase RssA